MLNKKRIFALLICIVSILGLIACKKEPPRLIRPLYTEVDMNNLPDGIYNVCFDKVNADDDSLLVEVYSEDLYDTVEVHSLVVGDILVVKGNEMELKKIITDGSRYCFNYWDSLEEADEVLEPYEGGTYHFRGPDDYPTYTKRGESRVILDDNCVLTDSSNLEAPAIIKNNKKEVLQYIKSDDDGFFTLYETTIRMENGKCVEINIRYTP